MKYKKLGDKIFIRIDRGEEIVSTLKNFCEDNDIRLGSIIGIGATNRATVGLYDVLKREYHSKELIGNYEIVPVVGNITTMDGELYLHLHVNLCDSEHKSFGGHLNSAVVSATFEGIIDSIPGDVERELDEETGLNILKI